MYLEAFSLIMMVRMASKNLFFYLRVYFSTFDQSLGFAKIDLLPNALAPHSIFPVHLARI